MLTEQHVLNVMAASLQISKYLLPELLICTFSIFISLQI